MLVAYAMAPLRRFYALVIAFATGPNSRDCITHVRTVFLYSFGANLPKLFSMASL
jgi:hypothetical protein